MKRIKTFIKISRRGSIQVSNILEFDVNNIGAVDEWWLDTGVKFAFASDIAGAHNSGQVEKSVILSIELSLPVKSISLRLLCL